MKLGFVGLGKMGMRMVERLLNNGHQVVVYNRSIEKVKIAEEKGAEGSVSISDLITKLPEPNVVWLMLTAGQPTQEYIDQLSVLLKEGSIIVDGGNSFYQDSIKNADKLNKLKISFLDVGVSGGVLGQEVGYCNMVGGEKAAFKAVEPLLQTLSCKDGYAYIGKSGAGHFAKMIHNAIEYGMLQAYAEGFDLLRANQEFILDAAQLAHLWNNGSVIRSWLLELVPQVLSDDPKLTNISGFIDDSGEGRWAVLESITTGVPTPIITEALYERFRSQRQESFGVKLIAALRNAFGGHEVRKKK